MKFLKSLSPSIMPSFMSNNKEKPDSVDYQPTISPVPPRLRQKSYQQNDNLSQLQYEDAQNFILSLHSISCQRNWNQNAKKRKINLFQKVEVEPHYLQPADLTKLLKFQFQLGSDIFLDRTQHLHQQISQINQVIKKVLETRKYDVFAFFESIDELQNIIGLKIQKIQKHRLYLKEIKKHQTCRIINLASKKMALKQKISLLKMVKTKNEAAFKQIDNIDKAFATEQSRSKLYIKINKLSELQKSLYVSTIKNRLISIAINNRDMVQETIKDWVSGKLAQKQVQKVAFMIYFINSSAIYTQNGITLDYSKFDKSKLVQQIKKIFSWKCFHYVKEFTTRERIYVFLNELIKKISSQQLNQ